MEPLLDIREIAKYLRFSYMTVYRMTKQGKLPFIFKVGGVYRCKRESMEKYFEDGVGDFNK